MGQASGLRGISKQGQEKTSVTLPPSDTYPRDNYAMECSLKFPRWIRAYLLSRRLYTLYSSSTNTSMPPFNRSCKEPSNPSRISEYRGCYTRALSSVLEVVFVNVTPYTQLAQDFSKRFSARSRTKVKYRERRAKWNARRRKDTHAFYYYEK